MSFHGISLVKMIRVKDKEIVIKSETNLMTNEYLEAGRKLGLVDKALPEFVQKHVDEHQEECELWPSFVQPPDAIRELANLLVPKTQDQTSSSL